MKLIRYLALGLAGILGLVVLLVGLFVLTFDPKAYAPRLQTLVQDKYQRTLTLGGDIKLKVFPKLGMELHQVSLSEPRAATPFAQLDTVQLYLALLPLLQRQAVVDDIRLQGAHATLIQHADGTTNIDDLRGKPGAATPADQPSRAAGGSASFDVNGIQIDASGVVWRDEKAGDETSVEIEHFSTGRIADLQATPIEIALHLKEAKSGLDLKLNGKTRVTLDLQQQHYLVSALDLHLAGNAAGLQGLALDLASPQLTADLSAGKINLDTLSIKLVAQQGTHGIQANLTAALTALLNEQRYRLSRLEGTVKLTGAAVPDGALDIPLHADATVDLKRSQISADLGLKVMDSSIQAKLGMQALKAPLTTFEVQIDQLDLDRLMATSKSAGHGEVKGASAPASVASGAAGPEKPLDLSALKPLHLQGRLIIGKLQVAHLQLAELTVGVAANHGHLTLDPLNTKLYQGSLSGAASVDAEGNQVALRETAREIAIGPLMHDLLNKNPLDGHGSVALDIHTHGSTATAMKHALDGTARFALLDGAINGINLAASFRQAKSVLTGGPAGADQAADATQKTDFSELTGSFVIRNGVAHNEDLAAKSPFLRLSGKGDIDIGNSTLDYLAQATLVADTSGQGGQDLAALQGLPIPVRLSGPFAAPQYHLEYAALLKGAAQAKVQAAVDQQKQVLKSRLQDAIAGKSGNGQNPAAQDVLKGLFGK